MGAALDKLQKEYGQEPGTEFVNKQVDFVEPIVEWGKDPVRSLKRFGVAVERFKPAPQQSKRSLKKDRRRS